MGYQNKNKGERYYYNVDSPLRLPAPWEEHMTLDRNIFYWNPCTKLSSSYKPVGDFAAPWQGFECTGKTFYYNSATGESTWSIPSQTASADHASIIRSSSADVWSNGRRATLVSYTNKELRSFA